MRIGLGCMALTGIYGAVPRDRAIATIHAALDSDIRLFDTAPLYGGGENEALIGSVLGSRSDTFIVTKFGLEAGSNDKLVRDSRPASMRASVEGSLRRLRRERIDLLLQHRQDPDVDDEQVAATARDLLREGKIAAFGLSATTFGRAVDFSALCVVNAVQNEHSLLVPEAEMKAFATSSVMYMAYAPLGRGLLASDARPGDYASDDLRGTMASFGAESRAAVVSLTETVDAIANRRATTRAVVALAWTLWGGCNVVAIPGAKSPEQVSTMRSVVSLALNHAEIDELDAISAAHVR